MPLDAPTLTRTTDAADAADAPAWPCASSARSRCRAAAAPALPVREGVRSPASCSLWHRPGTCMPCCSRMIRHREDVKHSCVGRSQRVRGPRSGAQRYGPHVLPSPSMLTGEQDVRKRTTTRGRMTKRMTKRTRRTEKSRRTLCDRHVCVSCHVSRLTRDYICLGEGVILFYAASSPGPKPSDVRGKVAARETHGRVCPSCYLLPVLGC